MTAGSEAPKFVGDAISLGLVAGTLAQWLPAIAALVSIVWGLIRIYETRTVQRLLGRRGERCGNPEDGKGPPPMRR